jgi:prepilin-type N-terminal cleavage/methylation domain-containing protein
MKFHALNPARNRKLKPGFTLVEMMVAMALSSVLMAVVALLSVYSARVFAAMQNYTDLDVHSRNALDVMGQELRQATAVVDSQIHTSVHYLSLTNANAQVGLKVSWNKDAGTLVFQKTGQSPRTCLTGCDHWDFGLYNKAPNISSTNISFNAATNLADTKVINMSWKCSRTVLGNDINTESVQTAQIVLRNKVN